VAEAEFRRYYLHYPIYSRMRQAYKDAMLLALYNKLVKEKVKVDENEIRKYYDIHKKDEFTEKARIRVQRIVVKDRKTAYSLLRKLRAKKVKADSVARAMTDIKTERTRAGYVFITEDNEPTFFKRAWRSPLKRWVVIRMKDGRWAVYRVLEKKKERVRPFDEVKGQIRQRLSYEKEKELYEKAMEYLKSKYHIKVFADRIEKMGKEKKGKAEGKDKK
jgi:parvulin-like peptidyl-prolyl isomerase